MYTYIHTHKTSISLVKKCLFFKGEEDLYCPLQQVFHCILESTGKLQHQKGVNYALYLDIKF